MVCVCVSLYLWLSRERREDVVSWDVNDGKIKVVLEKLWVSKYKEILVRDLDMVIESIK